MEDWAAQDDAGVADEEEEQLLPGFADGEDGGDDDVVPDTARCIVHLDVDAFYAQVEELRDPALRTVPLGITQKQIIVTCNYPARARGVKKLQLITDALQACPELTCVCGEDLTPYRRASAALLAVAARFGPPERLGMDELWVEVTKTAEKARAAAAAARSPIYFSGFVHRAASGTVATNRHRPMDVAAPQAVAGEDAPRAEAAVTPDDELLAAGSVVAAELRAAVAASLGLRSSAGVAHNKLLAKLASGLHKPNATTSLPSREAGTLIDIFPPRTAFSSRVSCLLLLTLSPSAARFLAPLPLRALRGVGGAAAHALASAGIATCGDARAAPLAALASALSRGGSGGGSGGGGGGGGVLSPRLLAALVRGNDASPVAPKALQKSLSVEDSFRAVTSHAALAAVLRTLAPDLVARCGEERQSSGRLARTLTVTWRSQRELAPPLRGASAAGGNAVVAAAAGGAPRRQQRGGAGRGATSVTSASAPAPSELRVGGSDAAAAAAAAEAVVRVAASLLRRAFPPEGGGAPSPMRVTRLALAATGFTQPRAGASAAATAAGTGAPPFSVAPSAPPAAASDDTAAAAAAAAASAQQRRAYEPGCRIGGGGSGIGGGVLSKREERRLREASTGGGGGGAAAPPPPVAPSPVARRWGGATGDEADEDEGAAAGARVPDDGCGGAGEAAAEDEEVVEEDDQAVDGGGPNGGGSHGGGGPRPPPAAPPPAAPPRRPAAAGDAPLLRGFFSLSEDAPNDASAKRCQRCGQMVPSADEASHSDWHLARALQREEDAAAARGGGRGAAAAAAQAAAAPLGSVAKHKRPGKARASPPAKAAKGPMDAFLRGAG